eukprot:5214631-Pyramimonas_sp.AAC.2
MLFRGGGCIADLGRLVERCIMIMRRRRCRTPNGGGVDIRGVIVLIVVVIRSATKLAARAIRRAMLSYEIWET